MLVAVPNVSEGRDPARIERLAASFATGATLLDAHSDPIHNRTVLTLAADGGGLVEALARGAEAALAEIDLTEHLGAHPRVGALDVCPIVWVRPEDREPARDAALGVARRLGETGLPVFLYGDLATDPARRERAFFRNGGPTELGRRLDSGELRPDYGPATLHRTAGATLVTARPPLAAFNLELEGLGLDQARAVAASLRESGGGLPGVRAIAIDLGEGRIQISTNVHDPIAVPLAEVVERVRELGGAVSSAEVVGLIPERALDRWPEDLPLAFDRKAQMLEARLAD